jgi:hypothetical protein
MNLAWKELRESLPPILLALGVIITMMLVPDMIGEGRRGWDSWSWGSTFHSSISAILLFISVVLGVSAYAVEEEQETLDPLRSHPIRDDDILATKLGIRLGLIFLILVLVGVFELLTGAWPIEWDIPTPEGFLRWAGAVASCIAGLGLGLYFGRRHGNQTVALLLSILVLAGGYIFLNETPVTFIFMDADGTTVWYPFQVFWLPLVLGVLAIAGTIRMSSERREGIPTGLLTGVSLGCYALVLWSLTILPVHLVWNSPQMYRDYWTMRFGRPVPAFETMVELTHSRMMTRRSPEGEWIEVPAERERNLLSRMYVSVPSRPPEVYYDSMLGRRPYYESTQYYPPDERDYTALGPDSQAEDFFVRMRPADDIAELLRIGLEGGLDEFGQMMALHTAGVENDPGHSDLIAAYLEKGSVDVQSVAAFILARRGDERALPALARLLPVARLEVQTKIVWLAYREDVFFGVEAERLIHQWLTLPPVDRDDPRSNERLVKRRAALVWYRVHGRIQDLPEIRRALWANNPEWERAERPVEEIDVWSHVVGWDDPESLQLVKNQLRAMTRRCVEQLDRYRLVSDLPYNRRRQAERTFLGLFNTDIRRIQSGIAHLLENQDPEALAFWRSGRDLLYELPNLWYGWGSIPALPRMADYGPDGIHELQRLLDNPATAPSVRFHAAMILTSRGDDEVGERALELWQLYKQSYPTSFWRGEAIRAFRSLLADGHVRFAGLFIEEANAELEGTGRFGYWYYRWPQDTIGPAWWNTAIVDALKKVSGEDYGWDLKAWTQWWEREKVRLGSGD